MKNNNLEDMLNQVMDFKLRAENKGGKVIIEVSGSKWAIKAGLSSLIDSLKQKSNLTEQDIKQAVEDGLKSKEEIANELATKIDEFLQNIKERL